MYKQGAIIRIMKNIVNRCPCTTRG